MVANFNQNLGHASLAINCSYVMEMSIKREMPEKENHVDLSPEQISQQNVSLYLHVFKFTLQPTAWISLVIFNMSISLHFASNQHLLLPIGYSIMYIYIQYTLENGAIYKGLPPTPMAERFYCEMWWWEPRRATV